MSDGFECPWDGCDYTSHSEHGIKCHHSQTHGESIGGVQSECGVCGSSFRHAANDAGRFCSTDCYADWLSKNSTGENNPNSKPTVVVECASCKAQIERQPYRVQDQENYFCDNKCRGKWQSEHNVGESHPNYASVDTACSNCAEDLTVNKAYYNRYDRTYCDTDCMAEDYDGKNIAGNGVEHIEHNCVWCDSVVEKIPSYPDVSQHFCDKGCYDEWQREKGPSGPEHWNWRHGREFYYTLFGSLPGTSFRQARRETIEEHGRKCAVCGDSEIVDFHHIVPVLSGGIHDSDLLLPLCPKHHTTAEWYTQKNIPECSAILPE